MCEGYGSAMQTHPQRPSAATSADTYVNVDSAVNFFVLEEKRSVCVWLLGQ